MLCLTACGSESQHAQPGWDAGTGSWEVASPASGGRTTIWDHGLQMARGSLVLAPGWQLHQDIATDPQTARAIRYRFDVVGPEGELVRGAAPVSYAGAQAGQDFDTLWRQHAHHSLQGALEQLQIGALRPSADFARLFSEKFPQQAGQARAMEAELRASRAGAPYAGRVYVIDMRNEYGGGVFVYQVVVSPPQLVERTVQANLQMAYSNQADPHFEARMAQIDRRVLAQMQVDHQRRMAATQAQFDAHQRRMATQRQAFDAQNQAWLESFRGAPSGSGGGSGYTHNDQFVDVIRDEESYWDPDSGQRVGLEAGYDRTFTNGLGDFHQTNDAFFDPASMPGDWQPVEPMQPR